MFGTPDQPRLARVAQYTTEGLERDVYYLYRNETVFGREQADVDVCGDPVPFPPTRGHHHGPPEHALRATRPRFVSNGTSVRCKEDRALQHGDQFRLGRHLFRFDLAAAVAEGAAPHERRAEERQRRHRRADRRTVPPTAPAPPATTWNGHARAPHCRALRRPHRGGLRCASTTRTTSSSPISRSGSIRPRDQTSLSDEVGDRAG